LILDLSDYGKFLTVSAFRAPQEIDPTGLLKELRARLPSAELQFFDCNHVAGIEHLEMAAVNALHAFRNNINVSRSLSMETLLCASAQRQIDVAIQMLGVTSSSQCVGFVAFSETKDSAELLEDKIAGVIGAELDMSLLEEWSDEKADGIRGMYGIKNAELEALRLPGLEMKEVISKAVVERVALLSTRT
jgi:tRNA threonylcarbamoyladenosine modification (KEOPS) complex Cgi121 subunit